MWKVAFLLECLAAILAARIGLTVLKFERLRYLTRRVRRTGRTDSNSLEHLKRVSWGVSRMARYVPRASCLTQALAGQYLLSRRGIPSTIRFGIDSDFANTIRAHAWLISGTHVVLGGKGEDLRRFTVLGDFKAAP